MGFAGARTSAAELEDRAYVELRVNTAPQGDVLVVIASDDLLVRLTDLEAAGITFAGGTRTTLGTDTFVSLRSLAPQIAYTFDPKELVLSLTVAPKLLGNRTYDLQAFAPPDIVYGHDAGGFLNYFLNQPSTGGLTGSYELAFTNGIWRFDGTALSQPVDGVLRGFSSLIWDDRADLRETVIGDDALQTGDLGSTPIMGGVTVQRQFSLNPYAITYPTIGYAGTAVTPSTAFVYVNGVLVKRIDVPPGTFNLTNLPVPSGAATTRVVIRDAAGNETQLLQNYYAVNSLLAKGETNYVYSIGFPRTGLLSTMDSYGPLSALAYYQIGATDYFSPGARIEASADLINGGLSALIGLPFGSLDLAGSLSNTHGTGGTAATAAYSYANSAFGVSLFDTVESAQYARIDQSLDDDRPTADSGASVSVRLGHAVTFNAIGNHLHYRDAPSSDSVTGTLTWSLNARATLAFTGSRALTGDPMPTTTGSVGVVLTYALGGTLTASASDTETNGTSSTTVSVLKPPPYGTGFGFTASATGGTYPSAQLTLQEKAPFGEFTLDSGVTQGNPVQGSLTAAGSIVTLGRELMASRPITDGFIIVQTDGATGLPVTIDNQPVGATNGAGRLVLPDVISNYGTVVAVDSNRLPLDRTMSQDVATVATPAKSGMRVLFTARTFQGLTATIVVRAGGTDTVPANGQLMLTVAGKVVTIVLNDQGSFYTENIPPGTYSGSVAYADGMCTVPLTVPVSNELELSLGTLTCAR